MAVWRLTAPANNMESIMSSKILAGAAALALTTVLVTAGSASAQNWGCYNGCYPNYAYAPAYNYAPPYGNYGGYYYGRWGYPGGPPPPTGDPLGSRAPRCLEKTPTHAFTPPPFSGESGVRPPSAKL